MDSRTVGSYFWYIYRYPATITDPPLYNPHGSTREVEEPFRVGVSVLLRVPCSRWALVLGAWHYALAGEDDAITSALAVRGLGTPVEEIRQWD